MHGLLCSLRSCFPAAGVISACPNCPWRSHRALASSWLVRGQVLDKHILDPGPALTSSQEPLHSGSFRCARTRKQTYKQPTSLLPQLLFQLFQWPQEAGASPLLCSVGPRTPQSPDGAARAGGRWVNGAAGDGQVACQVTLWGESTSPTTTSGPLSWLLPLMGSTPPW